VLPCCTDCKPQNTEGIPHNFYSDQQSACSNCCLVALRVSCMFQTLHHTIAVVTNSQYTLPVALLQPNFKPQNMNGIPHICYSDEHLVCPTCCSVALRLSSTIQTVQRTNTIETKIQSNLPVACCTNSKPHSTDCIPPNCYSDKYLVNTSCYPVALTVIPTIQTVHRQNAIVSNI